MEEKEARKKQSSYFSFLFSVVTLFLHLTSDLISKEREDSH